MYGSVFCDLSTSNDGPQWLAYGVDHASSQVYVLLQYSDTSKQII